MFSLRRWVTWMWSSRFPCPEGVSSFYCNFIGIKHRVQVHWRGGWAWSAWTGLRRSPALSVSSFNMYNAWFIGKSAGNAVKVGKAGAKWLQSKTLEPSWDRKEHNFRGEHEFRCRQIEFERVSSLFRMMWNFCNNDIKESMFCSDFLIIIVIR